MRELFDAIHSAIAPLDFFTSRSVRLLRGDTEILIIGTMHARHLGAPALGIGMLRRLIERLDPERIGIEARPDDLASGLVCLSPIDMAYVWAIAQQRHTPVFGFDSWSESEFAALAARKEALDFNSALRNDRMAEAIVAQSAAGGRHLLFMGYSHVQPVRARMLEQAFELDAEFSLEIGAHQDDGHDELALRAFLRPQLTRALDHLNETLESEHGLTNPWTRRVLKKRDLLAQQLAVQPASG